ncbi:MAG: hypothetical protein GF410_08035 [Chitinivibrionales bacterium]|nr:hypothetical protein [Chitinivibrionales bacterium]
MRCLQMAIVSVIALQMISWAEGIPNPGFENWTTVDFEEPVPYLTSNRETIKEYGELSVTKTTDAHAGSYAVRLETKELNGDTVPAMVFNCTTLDGDEFPGGIAISGTPTALTGYYKCDIATGDTAIFAVLFKKDGAVVNTDWMQNYLKIHGSQSEYTEFSMPFSLSEAPDSVVVIAVSSNAMAFSGIPGSVLQLDDLSFEGIDTQPAELNGGFENWQTCSLTVIDDWLADGDSVVQSTDAYANDYAVKLVTYIDSTDMDSNASSISLGEYDPEVENQVGGVPYTGQTDTLCGWYKYSTPGQDTGAAWIQLRKDGTDIHFADAKLLPASEYTYFEIPFDVAQQPDSIIVAAVSSIRWSEGVIGSELIIDNMRLKSQGEVSRRYGPVEDTRVMLNPAGLLHVPLSAQAIVHTPSSMGKVTLRLFDSQGRMILRRLDTGITHRVDLRPYATGTYILRLRAAEFDYAVRIVR